MSEAVVTANVTGLEGVKAKLDALEEKAPKIVAKANKEGAKILKTSAEAHAPVLSGFLKSQIKTRSSNKKSKGIYRASVGVGSKDFEGDAFYAAFVIWGHKSGSRSLGNGRKDVPAHNFLKESAQESGEKAANRVIEELKAGIEAAAGGK